MYGLSSQNVDSNGLFDATIKKLPQCEVGLAATTNLPRYKYDYLCILPCPLSVKNFNNVLAGVPGGNTNYHTLWLVDSHSERAPRCSQRPRVY